MLNSTNRKHDGVTALALLVATCLSFFLPFNIYPEWRFWTFCHVPVVLLGLTISFSIFAIRQPTRFDKITGICILIFIAIARLATPSISAAYTWTIPKPKFVPQYSPWLHHDIPKTPNFHSFNRMGDPTQTLFTMAEPDQVFVIHPCERAAIEWQTSKEFSEPKPNLVYIVGVIPKTREYTYYANSSGRGAVIFDKNTENGQNWKIGRDPFPAFRKGEVYRIMIGREHPEWRGYMIKAYSLIEMRVE